MKGIHLAVVAFVLSLILMLGMTAIGAYLVTHKTQDAATFSRELREGLVENCEVNGNPLREVVQKLLAEQITNTESVFIHKAFPQIPPAVLETHIATDRALSQEIAPVDCAALYPAP